MPRWLLQLVLSVCSAPMHASLNRTQITYDKSLILQLTLQEDPELKPLFEQAKSGHPTDLMKMLTDPALTQKVMAKLNGAPGPAASGEEPEINNLWEAAK